MIEHTDTALAESLERVRFEIVPMKGVDEQLSHLPEGITVTVTASPTKGVEATLDLTERLRHAGHRVVPHIAARMVAGPEHLEELLARIDALGIREVFVVAGDAREPAGPYDGAAPLLRAMSGMPHRIAEVGITGYPESHSFIDDATTITAMSEKAPYATHIVSQICFDAPTIGRWIAAVRDRGVDLPIYVGLPGVVDRVRLLRISTKVGLGDSMRYLRRQSGVVSKLLGGYTPDELIEGLAEHVASERANVAGWHLFTFNEVEETERWRQQQLARYRSTGRR